MADITPIIATAYTPESTTSTSKVTSSCVTSSLSNGVDYLVLARCGIGGSDNAAIPAVFFEFGNSASPGSGNTVIGAVRQEGVGNGNHYDSCQMAVATLVTGDGSSTLFFSFSASTSDTAYIGSQVIVAVPLSELTAGADYFSDVNFDGSDEQSGIDNTPVAIGGTITFNLPGPTQDWICLSHVRVFFSASSDASDAMTAALEVDSSQVGPSWFKEAEDSADQSMPAWAYILEDLAAGDHDFEILVSNRDATGNVGSQRHSLVLLRRDALQQVLESVDSTGIAFASAFSNTTFADGTSVLDQAITVGSANRYVLSIGLISGTASADGSSVLFDLRNETDGVSHSQEAGENQHDGGLDSGMDQCPTLLLGCEQLAASAKTYSVRYRVDSNSGVYGRSPADAGIRSNLILMELATPDAGGDPEAHLIGGKLLRGGLLRRGALVH